MALPGSRALLGWWRELAPAGPRRLWYAHALLHRVEALTESAGLPPLDALARSLAGVLLAGPSTAGSLADALGVPAALVARLLARLAAEGLVDGLRLTPAGEEAARSGGEGPPRLERRVFRFTAGPPPHFVSLAAAPPLAPPAGWRCELAMLEECLGRPAEWKGRHGFPADVRRVLKPPAEPSSQDWPRVPVASAEQANLLLAETSAGPVLAYPVQPDGWAVGRDPVWTLPSAAEVAEVFGEVGPAAWRAAWLSWCQQRSLPAAEVEACVAELDGPRLAVRAPARLVERLRQTRSDAVKGEAWLAAGDGRLRGLARVDLVEV